MTRAAARLLLGLPIVAVALLGQAHGQAPLGRFAYDLLANRAAATVTANGRVTATAGTVDFDKFVDGGWKTSWALGQHDQGRRVALVSGLSSVVFFPPLDEPPSSGSEPLSLRLTVRSLAQGQKLSVFVNETAVATVDVAAAWHEQDVPIPRGLIKIGQTTRVRLTFKAAATVAGGKRSAAAVERLSLGRAGGATLVSDWPAPLQNLGSAARRGLAVQGGVTLSYDAQIPAHGRLVMGCQRAPGSAGSASIEVQARGDDGATASLWRATLAADGWQDSTVDLSRWAGRVVRLDIAVRGVPVQWADLRVEAPAAAPPASTSTSTFDRLFVWMVDTLRADKVHVYNPKTQVRTPHFDAFAADATRFAWAQVQGTWSLPSHASILTGVYPSVHKAVAHESRLARDVPFVPELLRGGGFRTALFSSNGYISSKWGFDRGWDLSRNFIRESLPNGADWIWKTAKPWIMANGAKKQFVYFATVEPHVVYTPKKEYLKIYWDKPYTGPIKPALTGVQLGLIKTGKLKVNDVDKAYVEALHNAEITQADDAFASFVNDLKAAGLYETSVVVVISDHGDEFWEHGDVGHAQSVYQELVHVPLIIRAPGVMPKGRVIEADVEAMDLAPTLLELAGVPPSEPMQGASLVSLAQEPAERGPRAALTENAGTARGLKVGRYRLIMKALGQVELYDEQADPREQQNIAASHLVTTRYMRTVFGMLHAWQKLWKKSTWGTAANLREPFYSATDGR